MFQDPPDDFHPVGISSRPQREKPPSLLRNGGAGSYQEMARQFDNPLIRTATGTWRQSPYLGGNVGPDDSEVSIGHLPNVRTAIQGGGLGTVGMGIGSNAALKHSGFHIGYGLGTVPNSEHVPKREHVKQHF